MPEFDHIVKELDDLGQRQLSQRVRELDVAVSNLVAEGSDGSKEELEKVVDQKSLSVNAGFRDMLISPSSTHIDDETLDTVANQVAWVLMVAEHSLDGKGEFRDVVSQRAASVQPYLELDRVNYAPFGTVSYQERMQADDAQRQLPL